MAIVDEADSILIDEARVPFILAQAVGNEQETDYLKQSLEIARQLGSAVDSPHFRLDPAARTARLTLSGQERVDALVRPLASVWRNRLHREESIRLSLIHICCRFATDSRYSLATCSWSSRISTSWPPASS